ncbi:hypothetical protein BJ546DRAFT_156644 [Cryomyces antarcticus]|uniref:Uncharacterized protein n=1 Tax=Cryomyces antarcticus TaxID=329879 RepID=A0ABR0KTW6_9PEZI|nr:hypothetical protein LTR39_000979 [Cryomyces antarcticus]KAK5020247.1 hypothetical protein LTR60_000693 [Cryomyces antarcticus]KAK5130467.1 hypothetical protein LTR16_001502 [Cryomyces antarcticus]
MEATLRLLRIVFFPIEENVDVDAKCNVTSELLSVFHTVPIPYLKVISTLLVFHPEGIGIILGSVTEGLLSESSCLRVRTMLLSMADLLQNLKYGLHFAAGTSVGLRAQIGRIDEYMRARQRPLDQILQNNSIPGSNGLAAYPNGSGDPLFQFQLPAELLEDWPWPFDITQNFTFGPTGFE